MFLNIDGVEVNSAYKLMTGGLLGHTWQKSPNPQQQYPIGGVDAYMMDDGVITSQTCMTCV